MASTKPNVDKYWAGVGPKEVQCLKPGGCVGSIPMGVLCHKKLDLGLKPTCFTCRRQYKIPPGAERPYTKGALKTRPGKGKGKGKGDQGEGEKDKEIASLKKLLKANKVELPKAKEPNKEDKQELAKLKTVKALCVQTGLSTTDVETKIHELEAKENAKKLALPAIEEQLDAAKLKLHNSGVRVTNLRKQLGLALETGRAAILQVENLEAQKVTALEQQGFTPKQNPEEDQERPQPPNTLDLNQKDAWGKAVQAHLDQQQMLAKQASESLSKLLHEMENNFEAANKQAKEAAEKVEAEAKAQEAKQEDEGVAIQDVAADTTTEEAKAADDELQSKGMDWAADNTQLTVEQAKALFGEGSMGTETDASMAAAAEAEKRKSGQKAETSLAKKQNTKAGGFVATGANDQKA